MTTPARSGFRFDLDLFKPRDGERAESVVAVVRLILASVSLAAIYLDPTTPARYVTLTYAFLVLYALYTLILLIAVRAATAPPSRWTSVVIHAGDMIAATLLTLFTEGPSSPFFVLFVFALLAAGFRWGFWETVLTGAASGLLFGLEAVLITSWMGEARLVEGDFELNRFIIRCAYLGLLAIMVGYIAEHEKLARAEAGARASADERGRVARDLHDGVVQSLIGLKMQIELQRAREESGSANAALREIEASLGREIANLRQFMFDTSPVDHERGELPALLADLTEHFGRATTISARFVSTLGDRRVSINTRREVARIVQEALVNVRKHSGARHVLVSLSSDGRHCRLIVEDDGRGFEFDGRLSEDALEQERKGPRVIRERVRLLGGSLVIDSRRDAGARLEVSVPFDT